MYEVNISMFYEREEREYDTFYPVGYFETHEEAEAFARTLVTNCRHTLEMMLGQDPNGDWDGCSVDVRDESIPAKEFDVSFDVMPGRKVEEWHAEECHEVKE